MRGPSVRSAVESACVLPMLLRAAWDVRWAAPGALLRWQAADGAPSEPCGAQQREAAARIARAVARAADRSPWRVSCLVRALALQRLLDGAGLHGSVLRVGVRRGDQGLVAHAWVMYDGMALDDSHATSFTRLTDLRAAGRP